MSKNSDLISLDLPSLSHSDFRTLRALRGGDQVSHGRGSVGRFAEAAPGDAEGGGDQGFAVGGLAAAGDSHPWPWVQT